MTVGWTPEQLEELRGLIASGMTGAEVAEKLGRNRKTIIAIALSKGLGPWKVRGGRRCREKPDRDTFADLWASETIPEIAARFSVSNKTVYTWAQQWDLPSKRELETEEQRLERIRKITNTLKRSGRKFERQCFTLASKPEGYQRDMSEAGQAADFMRRDRRVFRCDAAGQQARNGKFWMCGTVRLTDAELIARASAKGWQPARWAA